MVRSQFGDPINISSSDVYLETPSGTPLRCSLVNGLEPGVNYRLEVPMDSGTASDLYQPTALKPFFQFKLKILIGQTIYLPIEMAGNFSQIGQPSQRTRIDLTLGVDSDGDGLPDAWEVANGLNPNDPTDADGDADGDGISNRNEYVAGTYAFDPNDGFRLVLRPNNGVTTLEFLAIRGRTYTVQGSADLRQWTPVDFRVVAGGLPGTLQNTYSANDVRSLQIEVPSQSGVTNHYFRAIVQ